MLWRCDRSLYFTLIQLQLQLQYITTFISISSCSEAFSTHFFQYGAQSTSSVGGRWGVWVDSNPCWTDDQSWALTTRLRNSPSFRLFPNPSKDNIKKKRAKIFIIKKKVFWLQISVTLYFLVYFYAHIYGVIFNLCPVPSNSFSMFWTLTELTPWKFKNDNVEESWKHSYSGHVYITILDMSALHSRAC